MLNKGRTCITSKASDRRGKKKGYYKLYTSFIIIHPIFINTLNFLFKEPEGCEFEAMANVVADMLSGESVNAVGAMVSNPRIDRKSVV